MLIVSGKDNEMLLSSILFIAGVFCSKVVCIMKLRNDF